MTMSFFKENKHDLIIAGSGFLGSLLLVGNSGVRSFLRGAVIALTGTLVAWFCTPVVAGLPYIHELGIKTGHRSDMAIAFFLGTCGWTALLYLQKKFFKQTSQDNENNGAD